MVLTVQAPVKTVIFDAAVTGCSTVVYVALRNMPHIVLQNAVFYAV